MFQINVNICLNKCRRFVRLSFNSDQWYCIENSTHMRNRTINVSKILRNSRSFTKMLFSLSYLSKILNYLKLKILINTRV